jgi:hypothetical protein
MSNADFAPIVAIRLTVGGANIFLLGDDPITVNLVN